MKLICVIGISGSGKSTYVAKLAKELNAVVVCPDAIRKELTGDESNMTQEPYIWNKVVPSRIYSGLANKKTVIFDATGPNPKSRRSIVDIGAACAAWLECHYFEPDVARAKRQNRQRARIVPEEVIDRQASRWKTPELSEGYDVILNIDAARHELELKKEEEKSKTK